MTKYAGRYLEIMIGDPDESGEPLPVGQLRTFGDFGSTRAEIDASAYLEDWTDTVLGQQDGSAVPFEIVYDPADEGHIELIAIYNSGEPAVFQAHHEPADLHCRIPALITEMRRGSARDGLLSLTGSMKIKSPGVTDISSS